MGVGTIILLEICAVHESLHGPSRTSRNVRTLVAMKSGHHKLEPLSLPSGNATGFGSTTWPLAAPRPY